MAEPAPVILLTFANDRDDPLRHLAEEARRLRRFLRDAERAGRCEVVHIPDATADDILEVFYDPAYRDRVAIFHYGGHAGSYELLLETRDGGTARAYAGGLATFLAEQNGLQLVFLNGCSTQPQVQALLEAGVSAVIATSQAIDDSVATEFAGRFYQGLASGAKLGPVYNAAHGAMLFAHGENPRHLYDADLVDQPDTDSWPWQLTVNPDTKEVLEWHLPEPAEGPGPGANGGPGMLIEGGAVFNAPVVFGPYIQGVEIGGAATFEPRLDQPDGDQAETPKTVRLQPELGEPTPPPEQGQARMVPTPPRAVLQWFVDREEERERFARMIAGDYAARILTVSGPEGIGKTWLRRQLYTEARQKQIPAFALDFALSRDLSDLSLLQEAALALGYEQFPRLDAMLEAAARRDVLIKVDAGAPSRGLTVHGDVEIKQVVEGPVFQGTTFIFPERRPEEWEFWRPRVTNAFFQDLALLGHDRGAALLFDSYDLAVEDAQVWIQQELLRRVCEDGLTRVWVVLVGEELPNLSADWGGLVAPPLKLDVWSAAVVREYLPKRCLIIDESGEPADASQQRRPTDECEDYVIISEQSVSTIFRVTNGRPDQVALIADFRKELPEPLDEGQVHEILARGIVDRTKGPVREALRRVALAEWFDLELLAALIEAPEEAHERLRELQAYSFVQEEKWGRHRLTAQAQQVLLESWDRERLQLAEMRRRLARYLEGRAASEADPRQRRELGRLAMGHWLRSDESVGRERLCSLFEGAEQGYWLSECKLLIEHAEVVSGLSALTLTWLEYLRGRLALAREDRKTASNKFEAVQSEVESGSELHALAEWSIGQVAADRGQWEVATRHYEDSLQAFTARKDEARQGQVMLSLGEVHLRQARALGGSMQPWLLEGGRRRSWLRALPTAIVILPFVLYARAIRHWRLPPLQYAMNYANWTLARLLLTAQQWFTSANDLLASGAKQDLIPDAQRQLAQTYHLLGWERDAQHLLTQLLSSGPVSASDYRKAKVRQDLAESELSARHIDTAIEELQQCLQTFQEHGDVQAQSEVRAFLGRAYLANDDSTQGLMHLRASLSGSASLGDRVGAGLALHALRAWLERSKPKDKQAVEVQAVLAETQEKVYFPRVADRSAQAMEVASSVGLLVLLVLGLVLIGVGVLTPASELLRASTLLRLAGWLLLSVWIIFGALGALGLLLILRDARHTRKPEPLDRIVTGPDAISRLDHLDKEQPRIPWEEVQAVVSIDRILWRAPLTLLSQFQIIGRKDPLPVQATMRWYRALRQDVEDHLRKRGLKPVRLRLDVRLPLGPTLLLSLVLLLLGAMVAYAVIPVPGPPQVSAWLGTTLLFLGMLTLLLGSSWWLMIHPLWVRYYLEPHSRLPLGAGLIGLVTAAVGWWLQWQHPFHPLRQWLAWTVFPMAYLLLLMASFWVLSARHRPVLGAQRSGAAYSRWLRAAALPLLLAIAVLAGLFVRGEWLPYLPLFRALACFEAEAYDCTVQSAEQALEINPDMVDGYYMRARASARQDNHQAAVEDFTYLIDSGSDILAEYYLRRGMAYMALDEMEAACTDLRAALDARRWGLSAGEKEQAHELWGSWECDSILNQGKE